MRPHRSIIPHLSIILPLFVIATFLVNAAPVRQLSANSNRAGSKAKSLFQRNCAKCHGRDGKGQTAKGHIAGAPDFTDPKWQELLEDHELATSIQYGVGQMPSFGGKLNNEQIKTLVAYVRAFKK